MKPTRTYQLARVERYSNSSKAATRNSRLGTQRASNDAPSNSANFNIFRNNEELRVRNLELRKDRDYEILGMGEFNSFSHNKEKRRDNLRSHPHQACSYPSNLSRTSGNAIRGPPYLTKEEVIGMCSQPSAPSLVTSLKHNKTKVEEYLNASPRGHPWQTSQNSWIDSLQDTPALEGPKSKQKFSLMKLKQKMKVYKQSWEKHLHLKKSFKENHLVRFVKCNDKNYRKKQKIMNLLQRQTKTENGSNCLPWNETLRSGHYSPNIRIQEVETIKENGINLEGRNKYSLQKEWIEQKHEEGCFFLSKATSKLAI